MIQTKSEMFSLVKIYSESLGNNQCRTFEFTVKDYKSVHGMLVSGDVEVTLVFDKDNKIFADILDISKNKDTEPNKRALLFTQNINEDYIKGSVIKRNASGTVSIYLLMN